MSVTCKIEIDFRSNEDASSVLKAIELDNGQYASANVVGNVLELSANAKSMPSMLHTLEDLLACIKVADGVVNLR
jgi:tRNA threonylcarbamoyladenosine modification (KEOPS) complex  Pcc1 subunit